MTNDSTVIKLENGLTALLIHDPEIYPPHHCSSDLQQHEQDEDEEEEGEVVEEEMEDGEVNSEEEEAASQVKKAAAAMCAERGSFSDPVEAQGFANFLENMAEHMLLMGSTKFPDENEFASYLSKHGDGQVKSKEEEGASQTKKYASYLSKHGGSSNAYTEAEHTCYFFDVKREFLKGALQRFSQFFVSPLLKSEAMEREVQAIDSDNYAPDRDSSKSVDDEDNLGAQNNYRDFYSSAWVTFPSSTIDVEAMFDLPELGEDRSGGGELCICVSQSNHGGERSG